MSLPFRHATALALIFLAGQSSPCAAQSKTPFRQVQMHVWISETSEQGMRDIGANLNYTRFFRGRENRTDSVQQVTTDVFDPLDPRFSVTLPAPDQDLFDAPLRPDQEGALDNGLQTQSGAGLSFSIINAGQGTIDGLLRSLEESDDMDLISKPELLVIEGMTAEIHAGGKVPFQDIKFDNKGRPQLNVAFKNIGVNLKITPTIRPDDMILLNLQQLEVTDVARIDKIRNIDLPVISKRSQTGVVLVPNGQALVIGGLSSRVVRQTERRVPFLGRIPLLGMAFRGRGTEITNTHLMIFVSPTIVDLRNMIPKALQAHRFWQEGGWKNRERIDEELRILEEEP